MIMVLYIFFYCFTELYGCPPSNTGEIDQIPKQFQLAADVDQVTQVKQIDLIIWCHINIL